MTDTDGIVVWLREAMDAAAQRAQAAAAETGSAEWQYRAAHFTLNITSPPGFMVADVDYLDPAPGQFMADNDPAAVLRRIAADRKTLDDCDDVLHDFVFGAFRKLAEDTVRNLAEGYGWTEGE